jgi:hypothetical protein
MQQPYHTAPCHRVWVSAIDGSSSDYLRKAVANNLLRVSVSKECRKGFHSDPTLLNLTRSFF